MSRASAHVGIHPFIPGKQIIRVNAFSDYASVTVFVEALNQVDGVRRLRLFGRRDKLKADRSKEA